MSKKIQPGGVYRVTSKHPNGYRDGTHEITVRLNADGTRYCTGGGLGCSRDYRAATCESALAQFFGESAMTVVESKRIRIL